MDEKLVKVNLEIEFCIINDDNIQDIQEEFNSLSEETRDPINNWFKLAKARGDISESENILLNLTIELHKRLDRMEDLIKNKKESYLPFNHCTKIKRIGHNSFELLNGQIINGSLYGRIDMPVFPKRKIPIYFTHIKNGIYKIDLMHNRDNVDYDSYITARERSLIREAKGYSE